MASVLLATCAELPRGDEDAVLLEAALVADGLSPSWVRWDDPSVDWNAADLVMVRSTWDYVTRRAEFLAWASSIERLCNPAGVLEWNTDKRYLLDLERAGVPVTTTIVIDDLKELRLPSSGRVVVKPSVGAGSKGAARFDVGAPEAIHEHATALIAQGFLPLLQPYVNSVDSRGETDCIFIDGRFSHAVEKGPMLGGGPDDPSGLFVAERIRDREASTSELAVAQEALEAARELHGLEQAFLYARVDLVDTEEGPVVLELELVEPSLFLGWNPESPEQLAAAIRRRITR